LVRYIVIIGFAIILAISNPTQGDFHQWFKSQAVHELRNQGYGDAVQLAQLFGIDEWLMRQVMSDVHRKDYVILSTYKLQVDGQELFVIGIAGQFIPIII